MKTPPAFEKLETGIATFSQSAQGETLKKLAREGQRPEAIIVTCADSRVAPETLFGANVGELFVIRVAGNVIGQNELASIEYAALALNVPVCYVLGHSSCGAVSASLDYCQHKTEAPTASIGALVREIEPAVKTVLKHESTLAKEEILPRAIAENVRRVTSQIATQSPQLAEKIKQGEFAVKGAVIDMENPQLNWLN